MGRRVLDEHRLALVEKDTILTAEGRIVCIHRNCCQAGAVIEQRRVPNAGNAIPDRDVGQAGAVIERDSDAGDAIGDRDAC